MSNLALKLIAENKKTRSPFLDLGNCGLTAIPEEVGELVWLEELSFAQKKNEFDGERFIILTTRNKGEVNNLSSLYSGDSVASKIKTFFGHMNHYSPLSKLRSLKKLWLNGDYDNRYSYDDLTPLVALSGLQALDVSFTTIGDVTCLSALSGLQALNVSNNTIGNVTSLSALSGLQVLSVSGTRLSDLTPLSALSGLQVLDASYIKVSDLTPLSVLSGLQVLSVSDNKISDLTPLSTLSGLQSLYVSRTKISDLTPLSALSGLQTLTVYSTKISDLTPLSALSGLQLLHVSRTKISDLTPLSALSRLQSLDVSDTEISDLTPLSALSGLQLLGVSNTKITDLRPLLHIIRNKLPVIWSNKTWEGDGIYIENCPLRNPPTEIVRQGNVAILNYFAEKEIQGVDHLYEAKMLIIGEGGAGKTSLLRRLYQPDLDLPEEYESTHGIDIIQQVFKTKNGRDFRLNVWDFGGQEIYHATHQFFLTKRSLYILLDDTRKDYKSVHDAGFKYWLEVIDLLSDHSPVLIFQNEKSGRSKTIDESGIKGKFDNVKEFYRGNLQEPDAADQLREAIEFHIQQLPHIGEELPAKWVAIRAEIERLAVNKAYISRRDYFDIYQKYLPFEREKALFLSEYLHDLGAFLHFQDDPLLARTVILQNRWATTAVFNILDDETVKGKCGYFDATDCQRLWQGSDYADMHLELLALMQKFELCFQLPEQKTWLAPQLLSPSRPQVMNDWARADDLVLRYCYEFLPKGMIGRLIVRMNRFVTRPDLSWNSGALFQRDNSKVLVEISGNGREIVLRARGLERKELLSVISADLDALNASFHNLAEKIKILVPCVCSKCSQLLEPEFFDKKYLLYRKEHKKLQVECPRSFEEVDILQLLDGIKVKHLPSWAEDKSKAKTERTIKIFLASSKELKTDRDAFDLYFRQQNDEYRKRGIYLEIIRWENFLDAMSDTRLQDDYNQAVCDCDIFVSLFFTKTGEFTEKEFDTAHTQFKSTGKPEIYTFFKAVKANIGIGKKDDLISLWSFQEKLAELGHFYTQYDNIEHLKRQFKDQIEKQLNERI